MTTQSPRRGPDLFWPIVLIGAGVILLLANLGVITGNPWPIILNLWPVILIVIGLDILFGRRSLLGGLIGALLGVGLIVGLIALLIAQPNLPALGVNFGNAALQTRQVRMPVNGIDSADITIDFGSGVNRLYALGDSDQLIDGTINYYGDLVFNASSSNGRASVNLDSRFEGLFFGLMTGEQRWDIGLNTRPTYNMNLDFGSGSNDIDLGRFTLSGGRLNVGSGGANVRLPAGNYRLTIESGSGGVSLRVPRSAGVRVEYERGSGGLNPAPRLQLISGDRNRDGVYETADFRSAANQITLIIDGGSGSVNIIDGE